MVLVQVFFILEGHEDGTGRPGVYIASSCIATEHPIDINIEYRVDFGT
jgi:hypothetical protein